MSDPYLYPGTTVLINHFNIRDQEKLTSKEHRETLKTLQGLHDDPVRGEFDFAHLREIHRRIFAPVYPFAGETRTVNIVKAEEKLDGASVDYAPFHLVRIQGEHHLNALNAADWSGLKDLSRPEDMDAFAARIIDVWKVHPFREGNTRTTMTFMHQFAEVKGFALDRDLIRKNAEYVRHSLVVGSFGETQYLTRILTDARQRQAARERSVAGEKSDRGQARGDDDPDKASRAATLEAYVERKLRKQFPNDPQAVERGMTTAREKIANMVAEGKEIPVPRVIDTRELDRLTEGQYRTRQDKETARDKDRER